jgi:hypothetical protein
MNAASDPVDMLLLRLGAKPDDLRILRHQVYAMLDSRSVVSPIDVDRPAGEGGLEKSTVAGRSIRK